MGKMICKSIWSVATLVAVVLSSSNAVGQEAPEQPDRVEVGEEAPHFELESLDGQRLSLESLRDESPLVLIFFRGTW